MNLKDLFTTKESKHIETKAATIETKGYNNLQVYTGQILNDTVLTPQELMQYNVHYVYTCNSKNSSICASIPLKLYYENKTGKKVVNGSQPVKGRNDVVEILEHPFLDLMKNVNPFMNYTDLASLIFGYQGLIGNAYVYLEKDSSGKPKALYPLLAEHITLKLDDANGEVKAYKYFDKKIYKPEEIIKFSNLQPGSLVNGKGELEACIKAVQRYCYYDSAESYLNKNNARPDFVAAYEDKLTENEREDVEKIWFKKFRGKGLGKPLITSNVKIIPLGLAPKDMMWITGRAKAIEEIAAGFGVPNSLIMLNDANLASSRTAIAQYRKFTIFPKMDRYVEKLNEQLLPLYDPNLYCDYDRSIEADPVEQATILKTYVDSGILSVNEAREKLGLEPIEEPEEPEEPVEPEKDEKELVEMINAK
jgi:HK97 family phage portal protein